MSDHEWTQPGADEHTLSPPGSAPVATATPDDDGTDSAVKTSARRGLRMPTVLGTLAVARFRRKAKAGPSAEVETPAEAGSGRRRRGFDWRKLPLATASRETRVGVAALLSFLILVAALILNHSDKGKATPPADRGKSTLLALDTTKGQPGPRGEAPKPVEAEKPAVPASTTPDDGPVARPVVPAEAEPIVRTSGDSPPSPTEPKPAPPAAPNPAPVKPQEPKPEPPKKEEEAPSPVSPSGLPDLPGPGSPAPAVPTPIEPIPDPKDKPDLPAPMPSGPPPVDAAAPPVVVPAEKPDTSPGLPSLPTAPPSTGPDPTKPGPAKPAELLPIPGTETAKPADPTPEIKTAPPEIKAAPPEIKPEEKPAAPASPIGLAPEPAPPVIPQAAPPAERAKPAEGAPRPVDKPPATDPVPALSPIGSTGRPPLATPIPEEPARPSPAPSGGLDPESTPVSTVPAGMMSIPNSRTSRPSEETLEARLSPPNKVADAPMPREEVGARDQVDPILHTVASGENFWTISRLYYSSGRYYKALHATNRRLVPNIRELYVGTTIKVPPIETLDPTLIDPPSKTRPSSSSTASRDDAPAQPARPSKPAESGRLVPSRSRAEVELGLPIVGASRSRVPDEADEPTRPSYKVRAHDTLRSIARDTLGDSRRYREILDLNRDVIDDPSRLVSGQALVLPDDAVVGRRPR